MAHNGGRTQIGLNLVQTGRVYPFINALKAAQRWTLLDNSGSPLPSSLSTLGYPIVSGAAGQVYTTFTIPSAADRPGDWRLRWTGTATLNVTGLGSTGSATNGDFTFSPGTTNPVLQITAGTNLTNVEMFHEDDEALVDAGEVFNTKFLDTLAYLNPGVIRFMDWQWNNTSNVSQWAHRKPLNYATYADHEFRASAYAGVTTNSGEAYSVAAPPAWGGLVHGALVIVKFNATGSTDSPTLNVGGTGAKTIRDQTGYTLQSSTRYPTSGKMGTLIYSAAQDVWMKRGGDTFKGDWFIENGPPIETMLRLCEEVGAHPWFCPPCYTCDTHEWLTGLATYVEANAPSWMIPRYEVAPNETWNGGGGFHGTYYAKKQGAAYWGLSADGIEGMHNWVGRSASLGGQALSTVYSGVRSRYQAVVGVQTHGGTSQAAPRMTAEYHVNTQGGDPAYDWVTHLSIANYFRDTYTTAERTQLGVDYAAAVGQPAKDAISDAFVLSATVDGVGDTYRFSVPRLRVLYGTWKTWAEGYGVDGLNFYEGGWSPDYSPDSTQPTTDTDDAYYNSRFSEELPLLTERNIFSCIDVGGEFPSHYYMGGSGVWALYDPNTYETPSTQVEALNKVNVLKRRRFRMEAA